jgi:hypothetical protein
MQAVLARRTQLSYPFKTHQKPLRSDELIVFFIVYRLSKFAGLQ